MIRARVSVYTVCRHDISNPEIDSDNLPKAYRDPLGVRGDTPNLGRVLRIEEIRRRSQLESPEGRVPESE